MPPKPAIAVRRQRAALFMNRLNRLFQAQDALAAVVFVAEGCDVVIESVGEFHEEPVVGDAFEVDVPSCFETESTADEHPGDVF